MVQRKAFTGMKPLHSTKNQIPVFAAGLAASIPVAGPRLTELNAIHIVRTFVLCKAQILKFVGQRDYFIRTIWAQQSYSDEKGGGVITSTLA